MGYKGAICGHGRLSTDTDPEVGTFRLNDDHQVGKLTGYPRRIKRVIALFEDNRADVVANPTLGVTRQADLSREDGFLSVIGGGGLRTITGEQRSNVIL